MSSTAAIAKAARPPTALLVAELPVRFGNSRPVIPVTNVPPEELMAIAGPLIEDLVKDERAARHPSRVAPAR
ncbi:MAG: hypothetical protein ABR552_08850 [Actinomycetota bacterium]